MKAAFQKKRRLWAKMDRGQARRRLLQGAGGLVARILLYALLICISYILLYPLLYAVSQAFRTAEDLYNTNVIWIPTSLTLDNFKALWRLIDYPALFRNTVIICLGSSLLQVAVAAVTGYGFARFRFKEKGVWMAILLLTVVLPPQIVSIPNFFLYKDFDVFGILSLIQHLTGYEVQIKLLDTLGVYYLPAVFGQGFRSGIFILIFWQFFRNLPQELEDAAHVDGAGPLRTFLRVMLPNCRAAIVVVFLFSLVWYWNDTYIGNMYMESMETVSMRLALINSDISALSLGLDRLTQIPYIQAGVLLSVSPLLLLYLVCQKVFVESVERAGIVG